MEFLLIILPVFTGMVVGELASQKAHKEGIQKGREQVLAAKRKRYCEYAAPFSDKKTLKKCWRIRDCKVREIK